MRGDQSSNRTAAHWIARLNADDASPADEAAFRDWLAEHPEHAARFEHATDLWAMVPGAGPFTAPRSALLSRRRVITGLATIATVGVGSTMAFQAATAGTRIETRIGEQRRVTLADGSGLLLDTDTQIRFLATEQRRRLWLEQGRIGLTVAPAKSVFLVDAGSDSVTAASGHFDLRRDPHEQLTVIAVEGRADIVTGTTRHRLSTGERLLARDGNGRIDRPDPVVAEAWRSGRAAFHDDSLSVVADEANRYSTTRLLIADPQTAALRISGMYRVGDNLALGRALASVLAVRLRVTDDAVILGGV